MIRPEQDRTDPRYLAQLARLREMARAGEASLDAGEGRELVLDALLSRVFERALDGHGRESLP